MAKIISRMARDDGGASAAEYALILGIVGAALAVAAMGLGGSISDSVNGSRGKIENCGGAC